jgi:hypothetical protein
MNWVDLLVPPAQQGASPKYEPLVWAKANCATYITNDAVQKNGEYYYRFYFGDSEQGERDRLLFILRWL